MARRFALAGMAIVAVSSGVTGCAFGWLAGRASLEPVEVVEATPAEVMTAPPQPSRARMVEVTTACIDMAKAQAQFPRTFRAAVLSSTHEPYGSGLWSVEVPFSAENAFGQRLDYVAACREIVGGEIVLRVGFAR